MSHIILFIDVTNKGPFLFSLATTNLTHIGKKEESAFTKTVHVMKVLVGHDSTLKKPQENIFQECVVAIKLIVKLPTLPSLACRR